MGARIRAHDWRTSPLGPPATWPAPLRTALGLCLGSGFPTMLYWGPDYLFFCNDPAYTALGGTDFWTPGRPGREIPRVGNWIEMKTRFDRVMSGETVSASRHNVRVYGAAGPRETVWSYSHAPIRDERGLVCGVFAQAHEITAEVETVQQLRVEQIRLRDLFQQTPGAIALLTGPDHVYEIANPAYLKLVGNRDVVGKPVREAVPEVVDQGFIDLLNEVYRTGVPYVGNATPIDLIGEEGRLDRLRLDFVYQPIRNATGAVSGIFIDVTDVTERVRAQEALERATEERGFALFIVEQQRALKDPVAIMELTCEALGRRLGVSRVSFFESAGGHVTEYVAGWNDGTLGPSRTRMPGFELRAALIEVLSAGHTVAFSDSRTDPYVADTGLHRIGVLSGIDVPLLRNGQWEAGFYLNHAEVRQWLPEEIALVRQVAESTWDAVVRARAADRSREELEQAVALRTQALMQAEAQLRQAQKMEAIGQLTGGIAHDFNNMLAVVLGALNLLQRRMARGDGDVSMFVDGAIDGAKRAANLTQRLLAFSRQQPLNPESLDANALVTAMTELLTRTLGEHIRIETRLADGLWTAKADPSQLENTLLNLAVNARDAMEGGGCLTIATANTQVDDSMAAEQGLAPGLYVQIAVTDTGSGMTPDVLAKAFDPFFTTKGVGKGTGLGLSQVFGFVRQSGGHVWIESEPGRRTTVRVYLPRTQGESEANLTNRSTVSAAPGSPRETVLVVEDDERVRLVSVEALRELGYTVLAAAHGREALALIETGQPVTLLFTDVVMPEMTGTQLAERARARLPGLKVLFTTGYTCDVAVNNGVLDAGMQLLSKPFTLDQLAARVRSVLDGAS